MHPPTTHLAKMFGLVSAKSGTRRLNRNPILIGLGSALPLAGAAIYTFWHRSPSPAPGTGAPGNPAPPPCAT
jgi:hypothetical protein